MTSLELNATKNQAWDIIVENGDIKLIQDENYITQKVKQILLTSKGEFFRDTTIGVPWFDDYLGVKNPDIASLKSVIRDSIKKNKILISLGVNSVDVYDVVVDNQTRSMSLKIDIATGDAQTTTEFTL